MARVAARLAELWPKWYDGRVRRAKIVCTLGPASREPAMMGQLLDAGLDVARLNFSHGRPEDHVQASEHLRTEAKLRDRPVAILQDLQGPKIRVGKFSGGFTELEPGREFTLTTREVVGGPMQVSTTYEHLPEDVQLGTMILLDDGFLQLEVTRIDGPDVVTRVRVGGILKDSKGINLPGVKIRAASLTEKDKADIPVGVKLGADFVALSFVRTPEDVQLAKRLIAEAGGRARVIAKIERPEAVERLEEIVDASDGIMVARGDLGVELGPEKVPLIQKWAIDTTNAKGKVVITATQMLESMITSPRPTRAETSDVANAVLDGSDALMLSAETASGRYPAAAVRTMATIITEVESSPRYRRKSAEAILRLPNRTNAMAHAAVVAARQLSLKTIAVFTEAGGMARLISEYRPEAKVVCLTPNVAVYHQLALYWGVIPRMLSGAGALEPMLENIENELLHSGLAQPGETVAITLGLPVGSGQSTNLLKVHTLRGQVEPSKP